MVMMGALPPTSETFTDNKRTDAGPDCGVSSPCDLPLKCKYPRLMPALPTGCFTYVTTQADVDQADDDRQRGLHTTSREALCGRLTERFGTRTEYITSPNTPSDALPYCTIPLAAKDHRQLTNTGHPPTSWSSLPNTSVAAGTLLSVCPPQSSSERCVYFNTTSPQTCHAVQNRFGVGAPYAANGGSRTNSNGATVQALPACGKGIASSDGSPPSHTPVECSANTADTTSTRFRVCSDKRYEATSSGGGGASSVAIEGCDGTASATATSSNGNSVLACQAMCANSPTCQYFKPGIGSCVLYDTYQPLTNISDTAAGANVYQCTSVAPVRHPGVFRVPDQSRQHASASTSLLGQIPCGSCSFLGSLGGCDGSGSCLPPFKTSGTNPSKYGSTTTTTSSSECAARVQKALQQTGNAPFSLTTKTITENTGGDSGTGTHTVSKTKQLSESDIVDCICNGVCAV